jgi:hypothetical protein
VFGGICEELRGDVGHLWAAGVRSRCVDDREFSANFLWEMKIEEGGGVALLGYKPVRLLTGSKERGVRRTWAELSPPSCAGMGKLDASTCGAANLRSSAVRMLQPPGALTHPRPRCLGPAHHRPGCQIQWRRKLGAKRVLGNAERA